MKIKSLHIFSLTALIFSVLSCTTVETVRFEPSSEKSRLIAYRSQSSYEPVFQKNDIIKVTLISNNENFTKLFSNAVDNNIRNQLTYTSGAAAKGFLVNQEGFINLPYVGEIMVHDRTREDVEKEITEKLKVYITEPIIQLKILNFKITVLGDFQRPGTFNIPNEKVSFIEAIGIAGDVNITANLSDVHVYREVNDTLQTAHINLNTDELFYSDYFMLKQNDIIFIPPNKTKSRTSKYSPIYIPLLTSVSLLLTTINIFLQQ
jgi:polysaccharide export outer membrane protein